MCGNLVFCGHLRLPVPLKCYYDLFTFFRPRRTKKRQDGFYSKNMHFSHNKRTKTPLNKINNTFLIMSKTTVQPIPVYLRFFMIILSYSTLFKPVSAFPAYYRLFQSITVYHDILQHMTAYSSLFQPTTAYYSLLHYFKAQSSLFNPIAAFSS